MASELWLVWCVTNGTNLAIIYACVKHLYEHFSKQRTCSPYYSIKDMFVILHGTGIHSQDTGKDTVKCHSPVTFSLAVNKSKSSFCFFGLSGDSAQRQKTGTLQLQAKKEDEHRNRQLTDTSTNMDSNKTIFVIITSKHLFKGPWLWAIINNAFMTYSHTFLSGVMDYTKV